MSVVLVADDEPAVLDALSEVVEDLGHQVVRARDGWEALQLARARRPSLVVTDHVMPRLSGPDLVRQLREDDVLREVPVLLLSASLPPGSRSEASAFLAKPFELSEFEHMVVTLLATSSQAGAGSPAPPPAAAEERLRWLADRLVSPLARMRGGLELLRRGPEATSAGASQDPLAELEHAVEELEGLIRQAAGPRS